MKENTKETIQGDKEHKQDKNQQLYGEKKEKDLANPENDKNPTKTKEESDDIDMSHETWHHSGVKEVERRTVDKTGAAGDEEFYEKDQREGADKGEF